MGKYVIIGGSTGIGKALVNLLEEQGHMVYATYNKNKVENRERVFYHQLDVMSDTLDLSYLPEEIDGLAYCPGRINLRPFKRFSDEDFLFDFKLQVLGATKIIQLLTPNLMASGNAAIVLFSTIAVQRGFNFHSQVAVSKGAIEGLTRSLAAELAPKVRVNAVAPSLTDTPLAAKYLNTPEKMAAQAAKNPLNKVGDAKEVAEVAAFLLTPQSSWVTGQIIHVDGGFSSIKQ